MSESQAQQSLTAQQVANITFVFDSFYAQTPPLLTEGLVEAEVARILGENSGVEPHPYLERIIDWWRRRTTASLTEQQPPDFPFSFTLGTNSEPVVGRFSQTLRDQLEEMEVELAAQEAGKMRLHSVGDSSDVSVQADGDVAMSDGNAADGKKIDVSSASDRQGAATPSKPAPMEMLPGPPSDDSGPLEGYNPAVRRTPSGRLTGSCAELALNDNLKFWVEERENSQPRFIRAMTNFRFVNENGSDVSVAPGNYGLTSPLWIVGVAATTNGGYDVGQRVMAGWWNVDEVTDGRAPMEMLWLRAQVNSIRLEVPRWYRGGRTKVVLVLSAAGEYVLHTPHSDYFHRWSACAIPDSHHFKGLNLKSQGPRWIDGIFYEELQGDVERWVKAGKPMKQILPAITKSEKERLRKEGLAARLAAERRGLGPELSKNIDVQSSLLEQVMKHPFPKNAQEKKSLEEVESRKKAQDLVVQSITEKRDQLQNEIQELNEDRENAADVQSADAMYRQYVVIPENEAGPSSAVVPPQVPQVSTTETTGIAVQSVADSSLNGGSHTGSGSNPCQPRTSAANKKSAEIAFGSRGLKRSK